MNTQIFARFQWQKYRLFRQISGCIRYREIEQFLKEQGEPIKWIALDDDPALFPSDCPNLIQCINGFGNVEEAKLRRALW